MLVQYIVQLGDGEQLSGSYSVEKDDNITMADVRAGFPYDGDFHLRWKAKESGSYVWYDCTDDNTIVPVLSKGFIAIKALPLFHIPTAVETPYDEQLTAQALAEYQRKRNSNAPKFSSDPSARGSSGNASIPKPDKAARRASAAVDQAPPMEAKEVDEEGASPEKKKGALSFLKKGLGAIKKKSQTMSKAFSSQMQKVFSNQSKLPSEAASASLAVIREDYYTRFSSDNSEHITLLRGIWPAVQFLAKVYKSSPEEFTMSSPHWKYLGFRSDNPADLASRSSILGLEALEYFTQQRQTEFFNLLKVNVGKRQYPLAAVVLQGAVMMAETLGVQLKVADPSGSGAEGEPVYTRRPYWELFEQPNAFEAVCWGMLFLFHSRWNSSGASLSEIPVLLKAAVKGAHECLLQAPTDLTMLDENIQSLEADWRGN